jgi:hypothetical protein
LVAASAARLYNLLVLRKLEGWLLVPHELLHVLAYRLLRRGVTYRLGDPFVTPSGPETLTVRQRVFASLFPLAVTCTAAFALLGLWIVLYLWLVPVPPRLYFESGPLWHKTLLLAYALLLTYGGTAERDIWISYNLLTRTPQQQ